MPKSIILSTENLNSYGTWLPVAGARLENFRKNPVMFYDHETYHKKPIGRWENIRVEGSRIIADPVFDEKDPEAQDVKRKWEEGFINGASMGVDIIELSEDPAMLKPGQKRPTVTKYEVYEASVTPLPNNVECLTLRKGSLQLSSNKADENVNLFLPEIKPSYKMEKIALKLGLAKEATEDQIVAKIESLLQIEKNALVLKKYVDDAAAGLETEAGEAYRDLIEKDPANALRVLRLGLKQKPVEVEPEGKDPAGEKPLKVSEILKLAQSKAAADPKKEGEPDRESFDWMQRNDPERLMDLKRSDPVKFQKLVDEYTASRKQKKA